MSTATAVIAPAVLVRLHSKLSSAIRRAEDMGITVDMPRTVAKMASQFEGLRVMRAGDIPWTTVRAGENFFFTLSDRPQFGQSQMSCLSPVRNSDEE